MDWNILPQMARDIRDAVGAELAIKLIRAHGGRKIYVPKKVGAGHPLAALLGESALLALVETYGGTYLECPKPDSLDRQLRDAKIIFFSGLGWSHARIAEQFNLSRRRVKQILSAANN